MNNILETNKAMLAVLETLTFEMIGSVAYDEEVSSTLRQQIAESICNSEETYSHPEYTWE